MDDQTEQEWLEGHSEFGTGLFLRDGSKTHTPNITHAQCVELGADAIAFKWVPDDIATLEELQASCSSCERAD